MNQNPSLEHLKEQINSLEKQLNDCKQIQEALKERERYLQSLIDNLQEGILVIDREYRIRDANKAFMDAARDKNEAIIGRFCYEILHGFNQPCDRFGEECLLQKVFGTKKTGSCLHEHVHSDGSIVFVHLLLSPLKDKEGNVTHVIEAVRDVTDLLKIEVKLKESEERYRSLFMNKYAAMLLINPQTKAIIDANPAACAFYGYDKENLTRMKITDINTLTEAQISEEIDRAKRDGREFLIFRHRLASGEIRDVEVYTAPITINGKSFVFSIIHDITLRKQAETALRESEERYRALIESTSDWIWEVDLNGKYVYASPTIQKILGYASKEVIGKTPFDLMPEKEAVRTAEFFKNTVKKQTPIKNFENVNLHKNGHPVVLETSGVPIYDSSGNLTGYRGIDRDITARKTAEEALQKAHTELEQRVEERTQDLKIKTRHLEEANIALKVLLKRRDEDKIELEEKVLLNVKELVMAYLDKLKKSGLDEKQITYISVMESNLKDIVSPFLRGLSTKYLKLTPMEIQVANLVKLGKSTKEIAELVNLSIRTIEFHRDNIRKKMGIKNKKVNLRTYLLSMQ